MPRGRSEGRRVHRASGECRSPARSVRRRVSARRRLPRRPTPRSRGHMPGARPGKLLGPVRCKETSRPQLGANVGGAASARRRIRSGVQSAVYPCQASASRAQKGVAENFFARTNLRAISCVLEIGRRSVGMEAWARRRFGGHVEPCSAIAGGIHDRRPGLMGRIPGRRSAHGHVSVQVWASHA
jgi:hypothetical protein